LPTHSPHTTRGISSSTIFKYLPLFVRRPYPTSTHSFFGQCSISNMKRYMPMSSAMETHFIQHILLINVEKHTRLSVHTLKGVQAHCFCHLRFPVTYLRRECCKKNLQTLFPCLPLTLCPCLPLTLCPSFAPCLPLTLCPSFAPSHPVLFPHAFVVTHIYTRKDYFHQLYGSEY
jgi:hypothetical protein